MILDGPDSLEDGSKEHYRNYCSDRDCDFQHLDRIDAIQTRRWTYEVQKPLNSRNDRSHQPKSLFINDVGWQWMNAHGVPTPIHPYTKSFSVYGDREAVFDAALRASHGLAVLEKESGLIRFDSVTVTAWRG
jgi:hypothetical protein